MNFKENHLLTYSDFMLYCKNNFSPYDKALIISKHLKEYCFLYDDTLFYCFDGSNEYKENVINVERYLLTCVSAYLAKSIKSLSDEHLSILNLIPCFQTICENENISKYLPQLMFLLETSHDEIVEEKEVTINIEEKQLKEELKEEIEPIYAVLADGETYCINKEDKDLTAEEIAQLLFS